MSRGRYYVWFVLGLVALLVFGQGALRAADNDKPRVVFVAGKPSHGYGAHEHYAGCLLLARSLQQGLPEVDVTVVQNGWPEDESVFEGADAIVIYSDGGEGHPVIPHLAKMDAFMQQGVGLVCLHYAVEVPKGEPGNRFLDWIGGYFETHWSVNPHWLAEFNELPQHPITRGVEPFSIDDEWYYHMRFRDELKGVTPILTAIPPAHTLERPDGPHSGNPHVRAKQGQPQHVAWATEREDGGRGFGFTGGHHHWNWGDPNFRKLVLNAITWAAHVEVPRDGITAKPVSLAELEANQDFQPPADFDREAVRKRLKLPEADEEAKEQGARTTPNPKPLFASEIITARTPGHAVDIDVELNGAKEIFLVAADGGDGFNCDWADWAEPRLVGAEGELRLTELPIKFQRIDWGAIAVNRNAAGGPLQINGQSVAYGLGAHANSIIAFDVPPGYTRLKARAGLDNGGTNQAGGAATSVQFFVFGERPRRLAAIAADELRSAVNAVAGLDVAEGLEATLVASEPELLSLTNLDIDHRGRIWVCEVVNYRSHLGERPEGDRILILEDTNGDGRADETKVFYQGTDIDSAMGICVLGHQVIVSASPNIFVFTDDNGDDVPDRKELLFTKTGQPQHDHSAHSFLCGPDGRVYWNFGNTGKQVNDKNGQPVIDEAGNQVIDNGKPYFGGMPFRCNLDGSRFEVLGHNFRNNYEVTVDSFGTLWQSDNDDDGNRGVRINYVMEYGNYGYLDEKSGATWQTPRTNMETEIPQQHWHLNDPGVVPNLVQTGAGSPTGICVYEGRLLPKVFWDQVLHCDAGPNVVRAYPVQRDGAGYSAKIVNLVHGARDNWFRPADVCVAPDGSVFITDWYDPGVGGHNMVDMNRGRLFRIAPPGHDYRIPKFDFTTSEGAAEALRNPNLATRYLAYTALRSMGAKAELALAVLLKDENPRVQARALWLLGQIEGRQDRYIDVALKHSNPDIRITGLRLARLVERDVLKYIARLLENERDPQVLRECALALRHRPAEEAAELWVTLATRYDGADRWYLEALGIAADRQWDAFLGAWLAKVGGQWTSDAGRDIVWRSRAARTPDLLAELILREDESAETLPRYLRAFDFQDGPQKKAALIRLALAAESLRPEVRTLVAAEALNRLNPGDIEGEQRAALEATLARLPRDERFVNLVARYEASEHYPDLMSLLLEHPADSLGVAIVRVLLAKGQADLFAQRLASEDHEIALAVVQALSTAADASALPLLLAIVSDENRDLELRRRATVAAAQTVAGARHLIELAEQEKLPVALKEAAASALNASPVEEVRTAAARLFPLPAAKDDQQLPPLQELIKLTGDSERGKQVFATHAQCANCHQVGKTGKEVGPALTDIGGKLSRQAMFESILFPSAGISHNYETFAVELEDGNLVTGLLVNRADKRITIKTQDAILRTFSEDEVAEIHKLNVSLMPADLQKSMTARDLVDVVEYLTTLKP